MGIDSIDDSPPSGILANDYLEADSAYDLQVRKDLHREDVTDRRKARHLRAVSAYLSFALAFVWLLILAGLLAAQGYSEDFHLSDSVLNTALLSTTATIIGLPVTVTKFIFRDVKKD